MPAVLSIPLIVLFGAANSWQYQTYAWARKVSKDGVFTRKELIARGLANICAAVSCIGRTPEQTLSRTLQQLRDIGIVEFLSRGCYRLCDRRIYLQICNEYGSLGEVLVARALAALGCKYEREKRLDGMQHRGQLRLDFYIPHLRAAIEFQGAQHERPVAHWGGNAALQTTQLRDNIKKEYCKSHGIQLLYLQSAKYDVILRSVGKFINCAVR